MLEQLMQQFMNSQHGGEAVRALQQNHGLNEEQAQQALHATAQATEAHTQSLGGADLRGGLLGALGGLVGGGGASGALQGGVGGAIAGRAGQMIAQRTGMDPNTASMVAATAAPFLMRFLQQHHGQQAPAPAAPTTSMGANQKAPVDPASKSEPHAAPAPWKRML